MFVRKVLFFIIAPYRMCGSAAHYCSFVNFMQVVPAWFSIAEQSWQNCRYRIMLITQHVFKGVFLEFQRPISYLLDV